MVDVNVDYISIWILNFNHNKAKEPNEPKEPKDVPYLKISP